MVKKDGYLEKYKYVLGDDPGIARPESGKADVSGARQFTPEQFLMSLSTCRYNIVITLLKLLCKRYHASGMTQSPFERTNQYILFFIQTNQILGFLFPASLPGRLSG